MRRIIGISVLLVLTLTACSERQLPTENKTVADDNYIFSQEFVALNQPISTFGVHAKVNEEAKIGFGDMAISGATFVNDKTGIYILAKDYGIVLSVPRDFNRTNWSFKDCVFENIGDVNHQLPDIVSIKSDCENPKSKTRFLLSKSGMIISFERYRLGLKGQIEDVMTFINYDLLLAKQD